MVEKKDIKEIKDKKVNQNKKKPKRLRLRREVHQIDAAGQVLGRLASQIAFLLQRKDKPSFKPYLDEGAVVLVKNASQIKITGKKLEQKKYYHHSSYPGGLKEKKMSDIFKNNPTEIIKRTVWNMLPKNKLRRKMIKRLKVIS